MCCCPVTIRNPKIQAGTFLVSVDKETIAVPCGHCSECLNAKRRDLIFRAYYEYLNTVSNKGFTVFDTLTHNELSVPRFGFMNLFDKSQVQAFIKRLKSKLEYDGYDVAGHFKYLIVGEYGENTYRVHWHVLWFSTIPNLLPQQFAKYVRLCWKNVDIDESAGFTDYRDIEKRIVNSVHGIMYVVKYISKSTSVLDSLKYHGGSDVSQFILNSLTDEEKQNYSCLRQAWLTFKFCNNVPKNYDLFPPVLMSKGLGISFLEDVSIDDLLSEVFIPCQSKEKQQDMFSVPSYFLRKVFYKYDKGSKCFRPNELYKMLHSSRCNNSIEDIKNNQLTIDTVYKAISERDRNALAKKFGFDVSKSPRDFINYLLSGRSIEHFCKYVVYFRNIHTSPYHEWLYDAYLDKLDNGFIDLFNEYRYDALMSNALPFRVFDEKFVYGEVKLPYKSISNTLFNDLYPFRDYDKIFSFIQSLMQFYKRAKALQYAEQDTQVKFERMYKQQFADCIVN